MTDTKAPCWCCGNLRPLRSHLLVNERMSVALCDECEPRRGTLTLADAFAAKA